jgi:hypothetical protein
MTKKKMKGSEEKTAIAQFNYHSKNQEQWPELSFDLFW